MALWDEVKLRYPDVFLANLTNPNAADGETGTVDDTYGTLAANSAERRFARYAALEALDLTDEDQLDLATEGVVLILKKWTSEGAEDASKLRDWRKDIVTWSLNDTRRRADPTTSSKVRAPVQCERQPWSDPSRFDDLQPDSPPARQDCAADVDDDIAIP